MLWIDCDLIHVQVRVDNVAVFVAWGWGPDTDSSEGHAGLSGIQQSKWISLLGEGSYNHMIKEVHIAENKKNKKNKKKNHYWYRSISLKILM